MPESSPEKTIFDLLRWAFGGLAGGAIGWLTTGLPGYFGPAIAGIMTIACAVAGVAFVLMLQRYLAVLASMDDAKPRSAERKEYSALRRSLAEGNRAARFYTDWLTKTLNAVDRFFGDAEHADRTLFPRAFGLRTPAPLWTAQAYDRCLLLALVYPIATIFIVWAVSGHVGPAEAWLNLKSDFSTWARGVLAIAIGFEALAVWRGRRSTGWRFLAWIIVAGVVAGSVAAAGGSNSFFGIVLVVVVVVVVITDASVSAITFAGAFAVAFTAAFYVATEILRSDPYIHAHPSAYLGSLIFFIFVFGFVFGAAGVVARSGSAAVAFSFALAIAVVIASYSYFLFMRVDGPVSDMRGYVGIGAVVGAFCIVFAVARAIAWLSAKSTANRWQGLFLSMHGVVFTIGCLAAAYFFSSSIWWFYTGSLLLFLSLFAVVNAPFDWLSLGLTRALLRRGLERQGWWPYLYSFVDTAFAGFIIAALALAMVIGVQAFDELAVRGKKSSAVLPLDTLFSGLATNPSAPEYWWVYALLLSTMVPSLVNLAIGGASLVRGVPGVPTLLLKFMPANRAPTAANRAWIATVLTAQVFLGAFLGLAAQFVLIWVIMLHALPMVGLGCSTWRAPSPNSTCRPGSGIWRPRCSSDAGILAESPTAHMALPSPR